MSAVGCDSRSIHVPIKEQIPIAFASSRAMLGPYSPDSIRIPIPLWTPVGRLGWPKDQARIALFLAADMSSFVTGHNIPVDGGTKAGAGWIYSPKDKRFANRLRNI